MKLQLDHVLALELFFDLKIIVRYEHENMINDFGTTPHSKQKIKFDAQLGDAE